MTTKSTVTANDKAAKKTAKSITKSVLTDAMRAENEAQKQTAWVEFSGRAMKFRKLYVPGSARGSVFGLFRDAETGHAFIIVRRADDASELPSTFVSTPPDIKINGVAFEVRLRVAKNDETVGALVRENGAIYLVKRAPDYDYILEAPASEPESK